MPVSIEMPKLSDTMTEGVLARWLKKEGDTVEIGDVLAEVETDKATMEMEAFDGGILQKILVPEGATVPIGGQLAILVGRDESPSATVEPPRTQTQDSAPPARSTPENGGHRDGATGVASRSRASEGQRIRVSPLAKKIAAERGIDLMTVTGSGPGGRIVRADVVIAPAGATPAARGHSGTPAARAVPATPAEHGDQRVPLSNMRRIIAERLLTSKTSIPHFYLNMEMDASALVKLRAQLNDAAGEEEGVKFTINDLILRAAVLAAVQVPGVNAAFDGDAIIQYANVHLAVAVAVEDGLVTPVIRNAQTRSLRDLSSAMRDLAARARTKKLKPEEFQGGTMTVSNLGGYGVDRFSAIINPPQAMILSVGAIVKKPVVSADGNTIVPGQRMDIGLSGDHRVVDGAVGAQYLGALRKLIETPTLMLI